MLVDALIVARFKSDLFDDFANKVRESSTRSFESIALNPGFLTCDLNRSLQLRRIVRHDFGADAILQRRDDFSARRVVFGVGRKDQHHIQRQTHRVTLNLHVAFLHDVEETDLNLAGEIRQFIDREDAAVRARQQPVMNRQLVAQQVTAFGGLDRIDVADDVGDGHVRRGKFFDKARIAIDPVDWRRVAMQLKRLPSVSGDGLKRIVVNFRAGDDRNLFVQQLGELANDAALGLSAQPEQDNVVPRENRVDELRNDSFVVADDAAERVFRRRAVS